MKSYQLALLTAAPGKVDAKAQHNNQLRKSEKLERYSGENFREDLGPHGVASWPLLTGGCASPSSWSQTAVSVHSAATAGIRIEGRGANKMFCAIMCPAFVISKFPKCCFENNNHFWVT